MSQSATGKGSFAHRSRRHEALGRNNNGEPFVITWLPIDDLEDIDDADIIDVDDDVIVDLIDVDD